MNISIISFSSRAGGNCQSIARKIRALAPDGSYSFFDFSEFHISGCGGCRLECFQDRMACPYIGDREFEMLDRICSSDLCYFIVPNYCDYPCSNFFIFNERSQCYFQGHPELLTCYEQVPKKFIVVSNTGKEQFQAAFRQHTDREPDILFLSARSYGKVSIAGDLMTSARAVEDLGDFLRK